jgi:hypothetical protein
MAQTGYTPILIYSSGTAAQAPAAGNLTNSTLGSELAINITDGKLFYKDNANNVQVIAWKTTPTTAGGTGLTSYTAGDLLYYATGTTLSKLAIGANTTVLTSSGSAPQWTAQSALSVGEAANLKSNATTGVMQIVGPGAGTTRVMTIPNANFTAARTDAAQNFTGNNTFDTTTLTIDASGKKVGIGTATPLTMFSTYDTSNAIGASQSTTGYAGWRANNTSGNLYLTIDNSTGAGFGQGNYTRVIWSDGAYPLVLATNGTNRIQIESGGDVNVKTGNLIQGTAAKGINFTANTPAAGMTSQLLNWYEEGTFTPTFVPSGTGFTSITYDAVTGAQYIRVGRIVHVQIWVQTTATTIGSASGVLRVGGLPFTTAASTGSTSNGFGSLSVSYADGFPTVAPQAAMPRANSTQIDLYYATGTSTGPASQVTAAEMGTGAVALVLAGTYICA